MPINYNDGDVHPPHPNLVRLNGLLSLEDTGGLATTTNGIAEVTARVIEEDDSTVLQFDGGWQIVLNANGSWHIEDTKD